jgi:alpha-ketoglutarate-dependent taurine dioxygenase
LEHHLVLFRQRFLEHDDQVHATGVFGPVTDERGEGSFHTYISNVRKGAVAPRGELRWHQDASFLEDPFLGLGLYAVTVDDDAAPTRFASTAAAYRALPSELRRQISDLTALHAAHFVDYDGELNSKPNFDDARARSTQWS